LRRIAVATPSGQVSYPAPAVRREFERSYGPVPGVGEHSECIRAEFMAHAQDS